MGIKRCASVNNSVERQFIRFDYLLYPVILYLILIAMPCQGQSPDAHSILNEVLANMNKINTLNYKLTYRERVFENGKIRTGSSTIKYQKLPRRVYIKTANGTELLWGPDMNEGDVLAHPSSFPFFTLNLDPDGYWMRKDQHHGIEDVGFDYLAIMLKYTIKRAGDQFNSRFIYKGDTTFDGKECFEINVITPDFTYKSYTVKTGETILTIARAQALNEYLVLKHNPEVSNYTSLKVGKTILLPTDYAPFITLFIDKQKMLPVFLCVEDEKGIFEEYIYRELVINPNFNSDEFSKDYKDYHF